MLDQSFVRGYNSFCLSAARELGLRRSAITETARPLPITSNHLRHVAKKHRDETRRAWMPREPVQRVVEPLTRFMHIEAASGVVLLVCTVVALAPPL